MSYLTRDGPGFVNRTGARQGWTLAMSNHHQYGMVKILSDALLDEGGRRSASLNNDFEILAL